MVAALQDKVAIITGAGRGIGAACAIRFAQEGARLLLPDINFDNAQRVAERIVEKGGQATAIQTDISRESSVKEMAKKVIEKYGKVDILLNNAALAYFPQRKAKTWDGWSVSEWDKMFNTNVRGTWLCIREIAPLMKRQLRGKIINISSDMIGIRHEVDNLHYATSKGAIVTMTRLLSRALGPFNITVNCIAPGLTATEATLGKVEEGVDTLSPKLFELAIKEQCINRSEEPADLAGTAVYLACNDSDFVTGQIIFVDGGRTTP